MIIELYFLYFPDCIEFRNSLEIRTKAGNGGGMELSVSISSPLQYYSN